MSCRTTSFIAAALLCVAACGSGPRIDLCIRGDADDVQRSMEGGTFELAIVNSSGFLIETIEIPADGDSGVQFERLDGADRILVTGKTVNGGEVANGDAAFSTDGTCVCIALSNQFNQVCENVACAFDSGSCTYSDESNGGPVGSRNVVLGGTAANSEAISDAWLDGVSQSRAYGGDTSIQISGSIPRIALVRAELTTLPRETVIESATIEFSLATPATATATLDVYRVLERWDEGSLVDALGSPNWTLRTVTESWAVSGVGFQSDSSQSREENPSAMAVSDAGESTVSIDLTDLAQVWVSSPPDNFGVVILGQGEPRDLVSTEVSGATRPRLSIDFRVE